MTDITLPRFRIERAEAQARAYDVALQNLYFTAWREAQKAHDLILVGRTLEGLKVLETLLKVGLDQARTIRLDNACAMPPEVLRGDAAAGD